KTYPAATSYTNLCTYFTCTSPSSTSVGVFLIAVSWSIELQLTDTGSPPVVFTSNPIIITVNPSLTAPVIFANPTTISAGLSSTLPTTTSFNGGTIPNTCQLLKKGPLDASFGNFGSPFTCIPGDRPTVSTGPLSTSGTWSFELQLTDIGSPSQVVTSNSAIISVNGALSAGAIAPSVPAIDSGQSITLTANAGGGTPPYSYQWYSDGACASAISSATSSTYVAS